MPKIKDIDFDNDIFDEFEESNDKKPKKHKKGKKKKKKDKNKKGNRKSKKHKKGKKKNKNKKDIEINQYSYNGNSLATTNKIYKYKYNKNFISKVLDALNVNVDVESKIGVSIKDETIAAAINLGSQLLRSFIEKRMTK